MDQEVVESLATDESDLEVTDMDYYKIRHQNDTVPFVGGEYYSGADCSNSNGGIPGTSGVSSGGGGAEKLEDPDNDTEESDIEVTDMDYYKIRHAHDQQQSTSNNVEVIITLDV